MPRVAESHSYSTHRDESLGPPSKPQTDARTNERVFVCTWRAQAWTTSEPQADNLQAATKCHLRHIDMVYAV